MLSSTIIHLKNKSCGILLTCTFEEEVSETEIRIGGRSKSRDGQQEEMASDEEGEESDGQEERTETNEGRARSSGGTWEGIMVSKIRAPRSLMKDKREFNDDHLPYVFKKRQQSDRVSLNSSIE